jgi:hypothetical protein
MNLDLSLNTIIISIVVGIVCWILKESIKNLISVLIKTLARVEQLDSRLNEVLSLINDIPKIKLDINNSFSRIKKIETFIESINHEQKN